MAIQTINLAVPGGDTPRSANTKINANFSNTAHAASRLVGADVGNLTPAEDLYKVAFGRGNITAISIEGLGEAMSVGRYSSVNGNVNAPNNGFWAYDTFATVSATSSAVSQMAYGRNGNQGVAYRQYLGTEWTPWAIFYTTANTTKDSNGFIKASSPVLRVFSDHIEGNDDGEKLGATFIKNGIGDYLIKGTTGLSDDGWYIELPQDANKNPLVAVEYKDLGNGDISVKTYKRTFSMETFMFTPDKSQPLDIPDTRWIDLRFNEIPFEQPVMPTDLGKENP